MTPKLLTLVNIAKGFLRRKSKEDPRFLCDSYTHTKIPPVYIPWDLFHPPAPSSTSLFTLQPWHPHTLTAYPEVTAPMCKWCWASCVWLIQGLSYVGVRGGCGGARTALTLGPVSVIFPPSLGSNRFCPQPSRRAQSFGCRGQLSCEDLTV